MIRNKPAPDLIRGGYRFSEKIMLKPESRYFGVGKIERDQVEDSGTRKRISLGVLPVQRLYAWVKALTS